MINKKSIKDIILLILCSILLLSGCSMPTILQIKNDDTKIEAKEKEPIDFNGKEVKILILDNSFIDSSKIKLFVEMIAKEKNQNLNVDAITVTSLVQTCNDIDQYPKIIEGYYDVIFLGGLYDYNDYTSLPKFIDKIKSTNTKIALFPVDNEVQVLVSRAEKIYPSLYCANWNLALDDIKTLTDFKEKYLSFTNEYKHSNELTGYIGACIIYSFLYNTTPDCITTADYMVQQYKSYIPGIDDIVKLEKLKSLDKMYLNYVRNS